LLYRYSEVFRTLLVVADAVLVSAAWLLGWWISVRLGWVVVPAAGEEGGVLAALRAHAALLVVTLPLFLLLIRGQGLYQPQRTGSLLHEAGGVIRATAMAVVLLVALGFFAGSPLESRASVAVFSVLAPLGVIGFRTGGRLGLRALRRRGLNQRFVLVLGAGQLAEEIIHRIHAHPEAGLQVLGVLADQGRGARRSVAGIPVLGGFSQLKEVLRGPDRVDQVILALPQDEMHALEKVLADLDDEVVSVKLVPDLLHVMTLRSSLESLDGLPIIGLRETPMVGWAVVYKRLFDLFVCGVIAVPALLVGAAIALAVWASNGRPILYRQDRTGLDGRVFGMWKFRSMERDAERDTGPVWSRDTDPRRTRLGAWLRRTSLDELPQLWNVLAGDMSLVGPRPERPVFIEEFKREIPGYMLRHKVKAGMTGWAQVHGWRGDTSLHERVEHDLYYIQNWSVGLDIRIILLTLFRGARNAS
jgi:exopolysaccharide biosynthesis polyprenyl glycosylphosphotransferase